MAFSECRRCEFTLAPESLLCMLLHVLQSFGSAFCTLFLSGISNDYFRLKIQSAFHLTISCASNVIHTLMIIKNLMCTYILWDSPLTLHTVLYLLRSYSRSMQFCAYHYVDVKVSWCLPVCDSYQFIFCNKPAVDPLLLECSSSGTETQITVDCRTNRPPATITCSFDGELEHPCKCVQESIMCKSRMKKKEHATTTQKINVWKCFHSSPVTTYSLFLFERRLHEGWEREKLIPGCHV